MMATTIAHSLKTGVPYCIPLKVENPHYPEQPPYIFSGVNYCNKEHDLPIYREKAFTYEEIPFMENICLSGYWQSEKYFADYREEVLKAFDVPYEFKKGWVSCHIRRGDYLKYPTIHPTVTLDYIHEAIFRMKMLGYNNFIFFSDDIDWCIDNIGRPDGGNFEFSEGRTELEDLSLASSCEHCIGSNSSFSWWIYWLNRNENKIGIFPKKENWFGEVLAHDVSDLYNPKWILI